MKDTGGTLFLSTRYYTVRLHQVLPEECNPEHNPRASSQNRAEPEGPLRAEGQRKACPEES